MHPTATAKDHHDDPPPTGHDHRQHPPRTLRPDGGELVRTSRRRRDDIDIDLIDLADVALPAALPGESDDAVDAYVERIERADAYVVVTPEYNHGYPASLKQAIDIPHDEWQRKAVGFVSYGGLAGGMRAVEQLRQVFAELHCTTVRETVSFHEFWERFDVTGEPKDSASAEAAATRMLDDLVWWASALRDARQRDETGASVAAVEPAAA